MADTRSAGRLAAGETLRDLYARMGLADRYYDGATPTELWRSQSPKDFKREAFILTHHPGYTRKDGQQRLPDVKIEERDGKLWVLGCQCVYGAGDYRGISVFDERVTWLGPDWVNCRIPKGTPIPENFAVTKDRYQPRYGATHYTIAPKNDMPLELFIQSLKIVASKAVRE
jgi:hypothetical protein